MSDKSTIDVGQVIDDRYEVESHLGAGGFSQVVAAHDHQQDRRVALKILRTSALESDPRAAARLRQEAEILQALDHPNIVDIYEVGRFADGQFLVMEHIDGQGLHTRLRDGQTIEEEQLLRFVRQILGALQAAHARHVLHRDLKPENILVTDGDGQPQIKLVDFGIAKAEALLNADDPDEGVTLVKTRTGSFVGTPRYSAPEMVVGDPSTPASDLFCLGVVVFEALMGRPLIDGKTHQAVINQLVFPRPFDLDEVPSPWSQWLAKMVEKSPLHRLQSVDEAAKLLDELFDGHTDLGTDIAASDAGDGSSDDLGVSAAAIDELYPAFGDDESAADDTPADSEVSEENIKTSQWEPLDLDEVALAENRRRRARAAKGGPPPTDGSSEAQAPDPAQGADDDGQEAPKNPYKPINAGHGGPRELVETRANGDDSNGLLYFVVFSLLAFVIAGFLLLFVFL